MGSNNTTNSQGHRKRLRERFVKTGLVGVADYEVVELLLTLAIPRGDVKPLAKSLIAGSEICAEFSMRRWK